MATPVQLLFLNALIITVQPLYLMVLKRVCQLMAFLIVFERTMGEKMWMCGILCWRHTAIFKCNNQIFHPQWANRVVMAWRFSLRGMCILSAIQWDGRKSHSWPSKSYWSILSPLCFLPHINKSMSKFKDSWNEHAHSTEGNMTPHQLFFEGINYSVTDYPRDIQLSSASVDLSSVTGDHV